MPETICRVIVYVTDTSHAADTVLAAGRLAESFGAVLSGLHVRAEATAATVAPAGGGVSPGLVQDLQQQEQERAAAAEKAFKTVTSDNGWRGEWKCVEDHTLDARDTTADAVRLADIVVLGQDDPEEGRNAEEVIAKDLVVDAGRPVLIVPMSWTQATGEKHVLVAWKPSREATRALHDALPFLAKAEKVTVTVATSDSAPAKDSGLPGSDVCRYLADRGISAAAQPLFGIDDGDAGEALMNQAQENGADLIVAGAYSHSRLREGIFGGVTRELIENTEIPAMLSH